MVTVWKNISIDEPLYNKIIFIRDVILPKHTGRDNFTISDSIRFTLKAWNSLDEETKMERLEAV